MLLVSFHIYLIHFSIVLVLGVVAVKDFGGDLYTAVAVVKKH